MVLAGIMIINKQIRQIFHYVILGSLFFVLTACFDPNSHSNQVEESNIEQQPDNTVAPLALMQAQQNNRSQTAAIITDQVSLNGLDLTLLDEQGGCQLKMSSITPAVAHYLKPMAPCYFMRTGEQLQTVQRDQQTILAVVGTPVKERCGQEVQGVSILGEQLQLSTRIGQGSTFCADQGLDSFHFSLFFNEA